MLSAFIDDGYTEDGFVAAIDRLMPAIKFTFRPLTRDELAAFSAQHKNADERGYAKGVAAALAKHITEWDVAKPDGTSVPATPENISKLKPEAFRRLHEIVFGAGITDAREADLKN